MMLTGMVCLSPSSIAAASDCAPGYFSLDDTNHVHPLPNPHPQFAESFRLAKAGNADEQRNMAVSYEAGFMVVPCPEKALLWYQIAASNGNAEAQSWIANYDKLQRHEYGNATQVIREVTQQASATVNRGYTAGKPNYGQAIQTGMQRQMEYGKAIQNQIMDMVGPSAGVDPVIPKGTPPDIAAQMRSSFEAAKQDRNLRIGLANHLLNSGVFGGGNTGGVPQTDAYIPPPPIPSIPAPQPSIITNCDSAGCWDDLGGRYNKGAGDTYFGPSGTACQSTGGMMQCP